MTPRLTRALGRPWTAAALVFLMAFGVYGFTTSNRYYGYEGETAALAEGLVKTGRFQLVEGSPLLTYGHARHDGRLYGRAGKAVAFDLRDAEVRFGMPVPDFWWTAATYQDRSKLFAWLLAVLGAGAAALLVVAARRAQSPLTR